MKKYKVGLFPMVGDLLHTGHILALKEAKEQCEVLIVAINTHPEGKYPVQTVWERVEQVKALTCVDKVIAYQGREDMERIASILPYEVRFLGDDYKDRDWDGREQEERRGIEPYFINRDHGFSSTELKVRVAKSEAKNRTEAVEYEG